MENEVQNQTNGKSLIVEIETRLHLLITNERNGVSHLFNNKRKDKLKFKIMEKYQMLDVGRLTRMGGNGVSHLFKNKKSN